MNDAEERPVHTVVNCETFEVTHTPMTDQEWELHKAQSAKHDQDLARQQQDDRDFQAAVAVHPDPLVQEIAKRVGLL
jgi:hypothetical protein